MLLNEVTSEQSNEHITYRMCRCSLLYRHNLVILNLYIIIYTTLNKVHTQVKMTSTDPPCQIIIPRKAGALLGNKN